MHAGLAEGMLRRCGQGIHQLGADRKHCKLGTQLFIIAVCIRLSVNTGLLPVSVCSPATILFCSVPLPSNHETWVVGKLLGLQFQVLHSRGSHYKTVPRYLDIVRIHWRRNLLLYKGRLGWRLRHHRARQVSNSRQWF
jgi:hypothetical protein